MRGRTPITTATPILLACGLGASLAACSPYDPDLGLTPYLCAAEEPRCPDNYACMEGNDGSAVCVAAGGSVPDAGPDAADSFQCAMDGVLESNNVIDEAFLTDVGIGAPMRVFGPLSICPMGDKDHFQINVMTGNRGIEVITRWESGAPVSCALLNSAGVSIANGAPQGTNAIRACVANLAISQYYAVAYSPGNFRNNYRIEMRIVDNCQ
jgi:hypothetical protein